MAAGYPVPVHYEDKETGEFLEINNDLEKTAIDGEAYYTNADNPFEVSLPENLSAGQPIIVSPVSYTHLELRYQRRFLPGWRTAALQHQ